MPIKRLKSYLSDRREWRRIHDEEWRKAFVPGGNGVSKFAIEALQRISPMIPDVLFEIKGETEKYYVGSGRSGTLIFIFSDGAQIKQGSDDIFWAEYQDYKTPGDLISALSVAINNWRST